jgi:hypothetical protein
MGVSERKPDQQKAPRPGYEPPAVTVLGTVAELTRGGTVQPESDGHGFAGATGSF